MATLSKHGTELGRLHKLTEDLAYFSDGKILRNYGSGWKLFRKVKDGIRPEDAWAHCEQHAAEFRASRPAYCEYKRQLHSFARLGKRSLVHEAVRMLGNDVDGLWSELNDMAGIGCSFDEVQDLVRAYEAYEEECKAAKSGTQTA